MQETASQPTFAHRMMYDGLYTFLLRMLNVACAAGLGILTARLLGPAGKGTYALPSVEAGLIVSGFNGLGGALSYFMLNRKAGRSALRPAFLTAIAFVCAGSLAIVPIALFGHQMWASIPAILSLPGAAALNLASGYAIGLKRVRHSTTINVASTLVTFAMMAVGLFLIQRSAWMAIGVWLVATTAVGGVSLAAVLVHARKLPAGENSVNFGEYVHFALRVAGVNLVSLLNYRADLYIIAILANAAELGMYTVAVAAAESLLVPTQVAALVTSPHIGSLDVRPAAQLTARCVRNNMIVALMVCGVLFALAPAIVHLLYGDAFAPVVPALRVLLIGVFAMSLGSPMSSFFTLRLGQPEIPMRLAGISASICIALSFLLVPSDGMFGAAIASTVAYVVGQTTAIWYFRRTARIGVGELLVPTIKDLAQYRELFFKMLADGRQLLRPSMR